MREQSSSRTQYKTEQRAANRKRWDPVASRPERPVQVENKSLVFRKLAVE